MLDPYDRNINYLRISITDKCNLRCRYCMPEEGVEQKSHHDLLSFEDIQTIAQEAMNLGIDKIRLTGGEPLVRRGIVDLVRLLAQVKNPEGKGLSKLAMTSNGQILSRMANDLKSAGLDSINISLDTLDAEQYRHVTRGGDINKVFAGIDAAVSCGLIVKINMVVTNETSELQIQKMADFCIEKGIAFQRIREYSLIVEKGSDKEAEEVYERPPKCSVCNRIRLLADGSLKPCLHSNDEIKVNMKDVKGSLLDTIMSKPKNGTVCSGRSMVEIGG